MTTNLDWQTEFIDDDDRQRLSEATLCTAVGLEQLSLSAEVASPLPETPAGVVRRGSQNRRTTQGNTHLDNAHGMIFSSCIAAADHMRAFVVSLRSQRTTVSNWTLARGAIEAFGRANYLLLANDAADLLARYVALAHEEFRYAHLGSYSVRGGGLLDPVEYLRDLDTYLKEVGVAKIKAPSITSMASDLLESTAPGSGGRARYSQLSGAAHGQTPSLGMFRTGDRERLVFPRQLAHEVVHMQVGCGINVGDQIVGQFASVGATRDRWVAARRRSLVAVGIMAE